MQKPESTPKPKRTYTTNRRRLQAGQTRRLILEAARRLFEERGYASTTIDAIAQAAGVAPETIYANFGSKQAVLKHLVEFSITGDEGPVPLLQREHIRENLRETDRHKQISRFAMDMHQIMTRMSPIFMLLRSTAKTDPEIAAILDRLLHDRLGGMTTFVKAVRRNGPLREGLSIEEAAATVWAVSGGEVFQMLVGDLGWSEAQYVEWLTGALERLLLP